MIKLPYEDLVTAVEKWKSSDVDIRQWGLPIEIKQLLFIKAPKCDKCGQATDERLKWLGMGPILCRCRHKETASLWREAQPFQPSKHNYLTEIEINAFALPDTIRSGQIIERKY